MERNWRFFLYFFLNSENFSKALILRTLHFEEKYCCLPLELCAWQILTKSLLKPFSNPINSRRTHKAHSQPLILDSQRVDWIGLPCCGLPQTIDWEKNKTYLSAIKGAIMSFEGPKQSSGEIRTSYGEVEGSLRSWWENACYTWHWFSFISRFFLFHLNVWNFTRGWKQRLKFSFPIFHINKRKTQCCT